MGTSPAKTIRGYELIETIGTGGFGVVYRAYQRAVDRQVAIKAILPQHANDPEFSRRFEAEAQIIARLEHVHIVPLYDFWREADGTAYLVMRWMQSGSLRQDLANGPWPLAKAVALVEQIAAALAAAHKHGIVHRDLKPENILLDEAGNAFLCDFGIAKDLGQKSAITQAGATIGSISHISPEQINGEPVTPQSDIYNFGIVLFELVTGQHPFPNTDVAQMLIKHLQEPMPLLAVVAPDLPQGLDEVIQQATAKDPLNRFADIHVFLDAFQSAVVSVTHARLRQTSAGSRLPDAPMHNLPAPLTPLIGREPELAELATLLDKTRLVTIVGPGGMGKTRLALAGATWQLSAANQSMRRFDDGVFFVSLADLDDADHIVPVLAESLKFRLQSGDTRPPKQQLLDFLTYKRVLLVLDNFEQLLDGAGLLTDILEAAPAVYILVTSRERLGLSGEQLFILAGLALAANGADARPALAPASKLFVQAAQRLRPDFDPNSGAEMATLVEICRLVGGMPLALELAAGWVDVLPLADIAAEIRQGLDFLETEQGDVASRHQSMRAVLDATWTRLTPAEQDLVAQLSVFRGGCTRPAAQAVTDTSLRQLARLVSKSLLTYDREHDRYRLHQLLRQYGAEKLAQDRVKEAAVRDRHCAQFCDFLARRGKDLWGPSQLAAVIEIDVEFENCRAAWQRAVAAGHLKLLATALTSLAYYLLAWRARFQEGERLFEQAAESLTDVRSPAECQLLVRLLCQQAHFCYATQKGPRARELSRRCLDLLDQEPLSTLENWPGKSFVLMILANATEQKRELIRQSLVLARQETDLNGEAIALLRLGGIARSLLEFDEAERLYNESLTLYRTLGNRMGASSTLLSMAALASSRNRPVEIEMIAQECVELFRELRDPGGTAGGLNELGMAYQLSGRFDLALSIYQEVLEIGQTHGMPGWVGTGFFGLAWTHLHIGQYIAAQSYAESVLALSMKRKFLVALAHLIMGSVSLATADFAEADRQCSKSVTTFRNIGGIPEIFGHALGRSSMVLLSVGKFTESRRHLIEALSLLAHTPSWANTGILAAGSLYLLETGATDRAIEWYTLAKCHPLVAKSRFFADVAGAKIAAAGVQLPPVVVAAAKARGQSRDLDSAPADLLVAMEGASPTSEIKPT